MIFKEGGYFFKENTHPWPYLKDFLNVECWVLIVWVGEDKEEGPGEDRWGPGGGKAGEIRTGRTRSSRGRNL